MDNTLLLRFFDFATALLIGALVGVEREKKRQAGGGGAGGLRTFALFAEAGAVAAWLSSQLGNHWIFIGLGGMVTLAILAAYVMEARIHPQAIGLTTEIASVVVYLLGGAVLYGYRELAVALAIVTSALLAFKQPLHQAVDKLGLDDIFAGLKLLIATFIILPILPDRTVDPWGALNPYKLWWLVILISALSLVGYVAVRLFGRERGTALTGFFGGLVSSTAVTLTFSRRSREEGQDAGVANALATGILLAWLVMFVRVLIMVAVVERSLLAPLLLPMGAMGGLTAGVAIFYLWRGMRVGATRAQGEDVPLTNPFSLVAATKFGLFFAAIKLVVKLVETYLPPSGLYALAAVAGLTDVDAITLSVAGSVKQGGDLAVAATAIVIAAVANTLVKCGIVLSLGAGVLRVRMVAATVAAMAGLAVAVLVRALG